MMRMVLACVVQTGFSTLLKLTVWDKLGLLAFSTVTCFSDRRELLQPMAGNRCCPKNHPDILFVRVVAIPPCDCASGRYQIALKRNVSLDRRKNAT